MYIGVYTYGGWKLTSSTFLITLFLIALRQGLLLNLKLVAAARLTGSKPRGSSWVPLQLWDCRHTLSQLAIMPVLPIELQLYIHAASKFPIRPSHHTPQGYTFLENAFIFFLPYRENSQTSVEIMLSLLLI